MTFVGLDLSMTSPAAVSLDAAGTLVRVWVPRMPRLRPASLVLAEIAKELSCCFEDFRLAAIETPVLRGRGALERAGLWGCVVRDHPLRILRVAPSQLKKFCGAPATCGKDQVRLAVYKRWDFEHPSNDVVDAFVLAQIARHFVLLDRPRTKAQAEILARIATWAERDGVYRPKEVQPCLVS